MNKLKQKRQHVYDYCIRIQEGRKESKIFTKRRMKIEKNIWIYIHWEIFGPTQKKNWWNIRFLNAWKLTNNQTNELYRSNRAVGCYAKLLKYGSCSHSSTYNIHIVTAKEQNFCCLAKRREGFRCRDYHAVSEFFILKSSVPCWFGWIEDYKDFGASAYLKDNVVYCHNHEDR